jgi:hypothetical protein
MCIQIGGVGSATPIGTTAKNFGVGSAAFSVNGIATTRLQSMVLGFMSARQGSAIATPAGYTSRGALAADSIYGFAHDFVDQTVVTSGSVSGNLNTTLAGVTDWQGYLIEIKGVA